MLSPTQQSNNGIVGDSGPMTRGLKRYYGHGDLHYITCSCFRRRPLLGSPAARDFFLTVFEQIRRRYIFDVIAYVVMPEHFHLLISEPERDDPSVAMKILKQSVSRKLLSSDSTRFWQPRFYDFNVFSEQKKNEKINYIHNNPVTRGLVSFPDQWRWSSFRAYSLREKGPVKMDWLFRPLTVSQKPLPTHRKPR
jgi:putative transposase